MTTLAIVKNLLGRIRKIILPPIVINKYIYLILFEETFENLQLPKKKGNNSYIYKYT